MRKSSDGEEYGSGDEEEDRFDLNVASTKKTKKVLSKDNDVYLLPKMETSAFFGPTEVMDTGFSWQHQFESNDDAPVTYFPEEFLKLLDTI